MRGVLTQVRAAVLRRRAQTAMVLIVCLLAGAVSSMAMTLLVRSTQPWDAAFARYSGAHLIFHLDASRVSAEQLAATASLPGVTAAGPPQETVLVPFAQGSVKAPVQLIGRSDPGGKLDRIPVVAGRWPRQRGEIVVVNTTDSPLQPVVGDTIRALTSRGSVPFRVTGIAVELGGHAVESDFSNVAIAGWALPSDVEALAADAQAPLGYLMAYRFQHAATAGDLAADRREVEAALPTGAESDRVVDWQRMRDGVLWLIVLLGGIIFAFTVLALFAVTVIVGSVVAGSVLSGYRDIGISKALGFTPAQVTAIYVGQMAAPALIGAFAGLPLGALLSRPLLDSAAGILHLPGSDVFDPAVDLAVPAGLLVLVAAAAFLPALRAAATGAVRAIALGTAPPPSRRSRLAAVLARLRAPRALSIGAGDAFARPVRGLLTTAALGVGIATATFSIGFQAGLGNFLTSQPASYGFGQDVIVNRYPGISDADVTQRLTAEPETTAVVSQRTLGLRVPGEHDPVVLYAMRGDPQALGYQAVEGRWFSAPGELVVSGGLARAAHLKPGDTIDGAVVGGPALQLRIVGLANDFNSAGPSARVSWETVAAAMPDLAPDLYLVKLRPGSNPWAFAGRVQAQAPDQLQAHATRLENLNGFTNTLSFLIDGLALLLMAIAAVGVFNAARLTTRERVHDIAVLKAVGMSGRQIAAMLGGSTLVLTVFASAVGVPLGIWLQSVIWQNLLATFGIVINLTAGVAPLPLALALVAAFVLALFGAALPARWAAATPVAQVLRSE